MSSAKNYESWISSYKDRKQTALQMRPTDGTLLVLDSKNTSKTLREFPVRRGYDLVSLLQKSKHLEEASATLQTIQPAQEERITLAQEEFQRIEKELLAKVEERHRASDPALRFQITQKIGELQRNIAFASEALQKAIVPVRYAINTEHEKRIISMAYTFPYTFEERSIPIVKKTA